MKREYCKREHQKRSRVLTSDALHPWLATGEACMVHPKTVGIRTLVPKQFTFGSFPSYRMPASRSGFQSGLKYYGARQDTLRQDAPIIHRYVEYSSTSLGEMVATSSNIKTKRHEEVVENTIDEMEIDSNDTIASGAIHQPTDDQGDECSDDPPIDQAYILHIQEEGEPDEEVLKRIRPKGVRGLVFVKIVAN